MAFRPYRISCRHIQFLGVLLLVLLLFSYVTHEDRFVLERRLAQQRIRTTDAPDDTVTAEESDSTPYLVTATEDPNTEQRVYNDYGIAFNTTTPLPTTTTDEGRNQTPSTVTKDPTTTSSPITITIASTTLFSTTANQSLSSTTSPVTIPTTTTTKSSARHSLPDCLIVGVRKAGTRALSKFLGLHPQILVINHEVQFFNIEDRYQRGEDWYRSQMPYKKANQVLIEKSAEYFHVMEVAERVRKMKPEMKIIVVLRDPFDRMVSDYHFIRRYAEMYNVSYHFAEVDSSLEDLVVNKDTGMMKFTHGGLHRSEYAKFLKHWRDFFPKKNILVINGDILSSANPSGELQRVEKFVGVKPYITDDMFAYNESKGFYCIKQEGCLSNEKGHTYPTFDPYFEKMVRGYFQHYNNILYQMLGVNFGWR